MAMTPARFIDYVGGRDVCPAETLQVRSLMLLEMFFCLPTTYVSKRRFDHPYKQVVQAQPNKRFICSISIFPLQRAFALLATVALMLAAESCYSNVRNKLYICESRRYCTNSLFFPLIE